MAFSGSSTATPSLFGQTKLTNSIFGSNTQPGAAGTTPSTQPQMAQQQSLFGQSASGKPVTGTQQTSGTSVLGQPSGRGMTQQQQPTTPIFGWPASGTQQQQQPTTSSFGQPAVWTQQQPFTSLSGQLMAGNQQQPTTTSLFGQPATGTQERQQPSTSWSGQSTIGTQQQQQRLATIASLLGQLATGIQQQQQPTTPLLGQSATGNQQQQSTTSLFGQPAASGTQQSTCTSPFGQPAGATQQQQKSTTTGAQQTMTPLFGQPATGTQQQQSTLGTSLFGSTTQSSSTTTQTMGLFGSTTQTQPAMTGSSLFWSTSQSQMAAPATGFVASTTDTLFGVQGLPVTMSISPFQPTASVLFSKATKFNDLPEEIKKKLEGLDAHIQGRLQISNDLKQRKLGQEPIKDQELIRGLHKGLLGVATTIQSDALFTKNLKEKTEQAVQDTIIASRVVDGFKTPQQHGIYLKNHASFPLEFFTRATIRMQERVQWYKNAIEQIERKLSSSAVQAQTTPQVISSTLQTQHAAFVSLAAKTAAVDAELQKVKALYTQLWRAKTGSMMNPFNDLDRGSVGNFGMEALRVVSDEPM